MSVCLIRFRSHPILDYACFHYCHETMTFETARPLKSARSDQIFGPKNFVRLKFPVSPGIQTACSQVVGTANDVPKQSFKVNMSCVMSMKFNIRCPFSRIFSRTWKSDDLERKFQTRQIGYRP